jgi:hypothetical protein
VGSTVVGTVSRVYPSTREYVVNFDDCRSLLEYDNPAPAVGLTGTFVVHRLLEWTHRIVLRPAPRPARDGS